jgi:uncharacterized RDD family membrane protein YckC
VSAAAPRPDLPQAAPFLRRSLAWLLDAIVLSLLATALAWRWIAPAAAGFITSFRALSDAVAQKLVDGMLAGTQAPVLVHALVRDPALLLAVQRLQDASWALLVPWCAAYALLAFAWHVAGDLSPWRGSPGKRLFGLRVETSEGRAPAPLQAAVREAGSALSWLTLNLGHLLALLPPKRQSLHDRLAGTRVVRR